MKKNKKKNNNSDIVLFVVAIIIYLTALWFDSTAALLGAIAGVWMVTAIRAWASND